ncbi:OsmC family protein [Stanieria sp. NIES-3757]|nr:OsmC family protein [Stanieria sp. NIES-3757]
MTVTTQQITLNGVDVNYIAQTIEAIEQDPSIAEFKFRAKNHWIDGGHNRATIDGYYGAKQEHQRSEPFVMDADEPPILAGKDLGANPVEYLLRALAGCLMTTMVYHAAVRGIKIEELEMELEGDLDLRGFLGLSNEVRKGYENIRVNFRVKTDEPNLDRLKALSKLSPVYDVTANGTNIDISVERK